MTVCICVRADGTFMFTTFIFKKLKTHKKLVGFPTENLYLLGEKGWFKSEFFNEWYTKLHDELFPPYKDVALFANCPVIQKEMSRHVILLIDMAPAHKVEALPKLKHSDQIHIVRIPPGCTPYLQPLDAGINHPIKAKYCNEILGW